MFYVHDRQDAVVTRWNRLITAKNCDMTVLCEVFYDAEYHDVPQIRVNEFDMYGFTVHVGGGPESHIDFPITPNGCILSEDIDKALSTLLGPLQGSIFYADYNQHDWDLDPEVVESEKAKVAEERDVEEGFRW